MDNISISSDKQSPKEKIAVITGAAGNMGRSMVRKFLSEGYTVIGTVTQAHEDSQTRKDLPEFLQVKVDLEDEAAAEQFIRDIINKYEKIDVAVLTVGGFATGTIATTSSADITQQYKLNFETAYNIARPVFIQMQQQNSGRIFLVGSKPGLNATNSKGMVAYGLSKTLIFRLAELMNEEAKHSNVVTAVIVPATIDTPQNRAAMPDAKFDGWVKPEAISDAIYYYCTEAAAILREPIIKVYNNG